MFLKNLVMSRIKKMTSFTQQSEEPPTPTPQSDTSTASRSRVDQDIVRESLGNFLEEHIRVFSILSEDHYYSEMGLPVIPFAQLVLHERNDEAERDQDSHLKKLRRKSNDLKKELSGKASK